MQSQLTYVRSLNHGQSTQPPPLRRVMPPTPPPPPIPFNTLLALLSAVSVVQVVAMRLPIPIVTTHLKAILDGILLWSADTKNQFKLKVSTLPCMFVAKCLPGPWAQHWNRLCPTASLRALACAALGEQGFVTWNLIFNPCDFKASTARGDQSSFCWHGTHQTRRR